MKPRRLAILISAIALAAALCLIPPFARFWARWISRPVLRLLRAATSPLPFALLEWGLIAFMLIVLLAAAIRLLRSGLCAALALLGRRLVALLLAFALAFCELWLPLYRDGEIASYAASEEQLIASCEVLIEALNGADLDFSRLPDDLPAKRADFSFWMRAFGITGFFSFPTGEALYSPDLPASAVPFVAVHEQMHAQGHAGEGAANIAAWEECISRGGVYADSARLWALRYSMELLCAHNPQAYAACRRQMNEACFSAFREIGGGSRATEQAPAVRAAFSALGVGEAAWDYDILAVYLASKAPV